MDRDKAGQELDEFYGDSDADENPFEPNLPSPSDGDVFDPSNTPHLSDVSVRDRLLNTGSQEIAHTSQPHMGANVAHGLHWQGLPGSIIPAAGGHNSFPPLAGTNAAPERPNQTLSEMVARRTRPLHDKPLAPGIEIVGTEVETETEGETECDHSASDRDGEKTSTAEEWVTNEQDWTVPIDVQLKAAQVGKADPHALRLLLRKAGFVPASRRKDIWRLLILGRVEPGMRTSTSTGFPDSPSEILALEAAILCTDLDLDNQRVVRVDVERTRPALEQFKRPRVKNLLTRVLTHHCKTHGLGYKQVGGVLGSDPKGLQDELVLPMLCHVLVESPRSVSLHTIFPCYDTQPTKIPTKLCSSLLTSISQVIQSLWGLVAGSLDMF